MKIGTSNIHNAIKFTVSIADDAYVDIFYGGLLFHQGRFVFVSKNLFLVYFFNPPFPSKGGMGREYCNEVCMFVCFLARYGQTLVNFVENVENSIRNR